MPRPIGTSGWLGAAQGMSEGITGMRNIQAIGNAAAEETQREAVRPIELENMKRKARVDEIKMKEAEQEQKWNETYMPADSLVPGLAKEFPGTLKYLSDVAQKEGLGVKFDEKTGKYFLNGFAAKRMKERMTSETELMRSALDHMVADDQLKVSNISNRLSELDEKVASGKELSPSEVNEKMQLDKQHTSLLTRIGEMYTNKEKLYGELKKKEADAMKAATLQTQKDTAAMERTQVGADKTIEAANIGAASRIQAAREGREAKAETQPFETWRTPGGETVNVRKGDTPPAGAVKMGVVSPSNESSNAFGTWGRDEQEFSFENYRLTGQKPKFYYRDKESQNLWERMNAEYWKSKGVTPAELKAEQSSVAGLSASIKNQDKIIGMMGGFVRNINKQIERTKEISQDIVNRVGLRALDMPIRELNTRFVGSGHERILESYLMEISREIGKLSTGSAASIAELSVDAQKKWDKIHDVNLSFKDLNEILDTTHEQANMRMDSSTEEREATKNRLAGKTEKETKKSGNAPPEAIELLRKNPNLKNAFKEKYGYIPEGF